MKTIRTSSKLVASVLAILALSACDEKGLGADLCKSIDFTPTTLEWSESETSSTTLRLSLTSGAASVDQASGSGVYKCTYIMSAADLSALNELLSKGVTYCPIELAGSKSLILSDAGKQFSLPSGTDKSVKVDGGYTALENDLMAFVEEVKTKGTCTSVVGGQTTVDGTPTVIPEIQ